MKFIIGTNNARKIEIARKVLEEVINLNEFELIGIDVPSGVPETPHNEETKLGAQNRVETLRKEHTSDYYIGLESGLVERYGATYEEAWCAVASADNETLGYSSGLTVPDLITAQMRSSGMKHYEVMRSLKPILPMPNEKDTWGNYSAMKLTRQLSFEEALRNALVQMFPPSDSLYNKKS